MVQWFGDVSEYKKKNSLGNITELGEMKGIINDKIVYITGKSSWQCSVFKDYYKDKTCEREIDHEEE